jgi:sugar/nucleoside kinase (ribokinase family)
MYDFVAVGDATLDVFMQIDDASVQCELDNANCKLLLNYADKIAAHRVDFIIGGNAANAAVGSRRLGLSSAFFSSVGDDDTGKQIEAVFHKEGVSTEYLTVEPGKKSNYSVVINFKAERTILVHHEPRTYNWNIAQAPKWFYVTSMGEGFEAVYEQVIEMMHQGNIFMAYNPGTHQLKKGLEFLKPSIAATTILFVNRQESALLLGLNDQSPISDMLEGLHKLGPKIIVITDGPKGAYAFDGTSKYFINIYDGPVVERTGCGDSFGTAFTVATIHGKTLTEAMLWGNANATSVVGQIGPQAGLLTLDGITQTIEKNKTIQPVAL